MKREKPSTRIKKEDQRKLWTEIWNLCHMVRQIPRIGCTGEAQTWSISRQIADDCRQVLMKED